MKVWMDISGVYNWKGNFTGIQRVNYNLAKELDDSELDRGLFVYHSGNFKEVVLRDLEENLKRLNAKSSAKKSGNIFSFKKIPYYTIITSKKLFKGTPLEPPLGAVYRFARKEYHQMRGIPTHIHRHSIFGPEDVVIVIDGNWQFSGFAESITSLKKKTGFSFIHVVLDLIAFNNPALANKDAHKIIGTYFKKIFKSADGLIAISESTKRDIEWFLKGNNINNKPDLSVIKLGDNIFKGSVIPTKPKKYIPKDFILAVSTIEVRKNYSVFYYVYNLAFQENITLPHLVIVGRKGWMAEEVYELLTKDPKINKCITILPSASDAELEWLYQNCQFSVFPSFYEGWGLPVAESLAHGKCCISSNTSSMPEVGKDLATYISPYDTVGILDEIVRHTDKNIRTPMERKIKDDYVPTTWEDTFSELKKIINQIVAANINATGRDTKE